MVKNMQSIPLADKDLFNEALLKTFVDKRNPDVFYKIEDDKVEIRHIDSISRIRNNIPEGFIPIAENTYREIKKYLKDGDIFTTPFASNLKQNLFDLSVKMSRNEGLPLFIEALQLKKVDTLKQFGFPLIPKKIDLDQCRQLFDYAYSEKLSGIETLSILESIPIARNYNNDTQKAFIKAFSFLDSVQEKIENLSKPTQTDPAIIVFNQKEKLLKNFIKLNEKFFDKGPNRVWFINMIKELEPQLNTSELLGEKAVELFEEDTWKHATVELSKHGLNQNYPMKPSVSTYNAQSTYKSALSQFATFIASNDTKLGWELNVEQAHIINKKNGNYLFLLAHSNKEPDTEKFRKILKNFLDYLKPSLMEEDRAVSQSIGSVFSDKAKLKTIMSNVVLYTDLNDDMIDTNKPTKRAKL